MFNTVSLHYKIMIICGIIFAVPDFQVFEHQLVLCDIVPNIVLTVHTITKVS